MVKSKSTGQFVSSKVSTYDARDQVITAMFVIGTLVLLFG